jgi:hypothetical protein
MPGFNLAPTVNLVFQKESQIQALWAVYTAVQFTYGGFGLSQYHDAIKMPFLLGAAITLGVWAFDIGHLSMILQCIKQKMAIENEIAGDAQLGDDEKQSIARMIDGNEEDMVDRIYDRLFGWAKPASIATFVHILIDCCASMALLLRVNWYSPLW